MTDLYRSQRFRVRAPRATIRPDNPENRTQPRGRSARTFRQSRQSSYDRENRQKTVRQARDRVPGDRPTLPPPAPSAGPRGGGAAPPREPSRPGPWHRPQPGEPAPARRPAAAPCRASEQLADREGGNVKRLRVVALTIIGERRLRRLGLRLGGAGVAVAGGGSAAVRFRFRRRAAVPESSSTRPVGWEPSCPDR